MDKRIDITGPTGTVGTHTVARDARDTTIPIHGDAEIRLFAAPGDIASMRRAGQDLIIQYGDGTVVRLARYFATASEAVPSLVLDDASGADGAEHLYRATLDPSAYPGAATADAPDSVVAFTWAPVATDGGNGLVMPLVLGGLAALGVVIGVSESGGGGGSVQPGKGTGTAPHTPTDAGAGNSADHGGAGASQLAAVTGRFSAGGTAFVGHGEANAVIAITDASGRMVGTGTADAQGNFTVSLSTPQNNGEQVRITETLPEGMSAATTITAPDGTAPGAPVVDATHGEAGSVLSGTAEAGSKVAIDVNGDGQADYTAMADQQGHWTVSLASALAGGTVVSVTASDAAGNVSQHGTTVVAAGGDDTPPAEPGAPSGPDTTAPDAPTILSAAATDSTSTLSGTAEAGSMVTVAADGSVIGAPVQADASGHWSITAPTTLSEGYHAFTATASDAAGNVSTSSYTHYADVEPASDQPVTPPPASDPTTSTSVVAINTGNLGSSDVLTLAGVGNQPFVAYDPHDNLQSVSVDLTNVTYQGYPFNLTASQTLATELGLQFDVQHAISGLDESSTLTITSLNGGTMDNQAVLELLDSVYLTGPDSFILSLNDIGGRYTVATTDANGFSASTNLEVYYVPQDHHIGVSSPTSSLLLGTTDDDTITGTAANEHLYGFGGDDTLHGGDGNDLLRGGAGADSLYGDGGDDVLVYSAADVAIDGGDGTDTLLIEDAVASIVGTTPVRNIEIIQLNVNNTAHTLTLDAAGAAKATGDGSPLTINGSQQDTVNLKGGESHGQVLVNNHVYDAYMLGSTTVQVQDGVHVNLLPA